ncbi:meiotic 218 [Lycorma delicatula]|uniref:meiotic 218 n=1 Tax=Lycorma delicatula TaxID=130591 RepID=UPI003F517EDD
MNESSNKYAFPFHYCVYINFPELLDISDQIATLLLKEPHVFKNLVKDVLHCTITIFSNVKLHLSDFAISLRTNLPCIPSIVTSSVNSMKSGLFIIHGVLIATTVPIKYLRSTVYECPIKECENNILKRRVHGKYNTQNNVKCSFCNSNKKEVLGAQEWSEQVIGVLIDPNALQLSTFNRSQGFTVFFQDDLCQNLLLGACYNVTVYYDDGCLIACSAYKLIPDAQARLQLGISFKPIPLSIQKLINFLSVNGPQSPWALTTALSSQLAPFYAPFSCFLHLKAGILLSLVSQGSNSKPVHLLCLGTDGKSLLSHCSTKLSRRVITGGMFNISSDKSFLNIESDTIWLEAGPLLMADGGICYISDWSKFEQSHSSITLQIKKALENGEVQLEMQGAQKFGPSLNYSPCYPLSCSVWTEYNYKPIIRNKSKQSLLSVIELFGMPFISTCESQAEIEEFVKHTLMNATSTGVNRINHLLHDSVPEVDLKMYLEIVSSYPVTISQKASNLLKKYFVALRRSRPGCLPLSTIKIMAALSEAHARIAMRQEVTEEDVIYIIYLYEQSFNNIYGPSFMQNLQLNKPTLSSESTIPEQVDINIRKLSVWLEDSLKSLVCDESFPNMFVKE